MVWSRFEPKKSHRTKSSNLVDKETPFYYFVNNGDLSIVWANVVIFAVGHLLGVQAVYNLFSLRSLTQCYSLMFTNLLTVLIGVGVTGGAHRLWAHKSYQARLPLQILLMIGQTLTGQNCIFIWARDHRVHHKWSDTDADPHNTRRGFFFAHVGWLLRKKHPEMLVKAKTLNFDDLLNDPLVKFQKDNYWLLYFVFSVYLPMVVPVYGWGETWYRSFLLTYVLRYILSLHVTWFVNSAAHMFGDRPYNAKIPPVENPWVSVIAYGEGYHNYHHHFPSDYQASEDGHGFNITRHFIDLMATLGQAYNLKVTSKAVIAATRAKTLAMKSGHGHLEYEGEYETKAQSFFSDDINKKPLLKRLPMS
ncbi:Stearoyl-CoA desaturase 5 [Halotydeus destructor]|nr:Stearoyl-CoA desaturase 5 [Halotydeus destructor]